MEQERINGYTLDELREINNVGSASEQDLQNLGMMEAPQQQPQQVQAEDAKPEHTNKILNTADKLGLETPAADKEYQKLSVGDSLKDAAVSLGVEASHIFAPKANELNYESKTRLGEAMKYGYRYLAGTASLFLGGGEIGAAIKGVGAINKASKIEKIGSGIQKLFAGADIIKTGESASKAAQVGAKVVNASLGGAFSGAIADYTLYRPEDGEGHMADAFGDTDNTFIKWLQSNPNDTETDAKFKNLVEGFVMGLGTGNIVEFGVKPLFGRLLKNIKVAVQAETPEVAKAALNDVALDEVKLDKFSNKADMYNSVKDLNSEAETTGADASQLVINKMNVNDVPEAQKMLKVLQDGEDVFLHQDGTWDIKVNNWEDAQKVSKEEYIKQSKAKDVNNAKDMFNDKEVFSGDSAISDMDAATKHTWTNRGWIGENENLINATDKGELKGNVTKANKIAKNYKDKWQVDNNIKVEFVDGLNIKGEGVEGNTQATTYLGKSQRGNKLPDITIQIDKNAKNPYATLRSELEHARDIASGSVPNQSEKHFSRYDGINEGEAAYDYVYKKSQGKAGKLNTDAVIPEVNKADLSPVKESVDAIAPIEAQKALKTDSEGLNPEQLTLDFNNKVNNAKTTEELLDKSLNGDTKPQSLADMDSIINKTVADDAEISGFKWENIAEDSEGLVKKLKDIADSEDISTFKELFIKGDTKNLDILTRKVLAAQKLESMLMDKAATLGENAPLEAQKSIVDMIQHLSNYTKETGSGSGRLLEARKFINKGSETFGSMRLSNLAKEGIKEFSDLLVKDIKEMFNLNFTRGEKIDFKTAKQELFTKVAQYGDGQFLELLTKDAEFAKGFNDTLDNLLKNQDNLNPDSVYKQIEDVITANQYKEVLSAAKLAPTKEGKIKTIKNWSAAQGGVASYYVHNLLSGLGSIAKNVGSGVLNTAYFPARKVVAGMLGGGEAMSKEGWNTYKSMMANWTESWELCKQAFISGEGKLTNVGTDTLNMDEDAVFKGFHDLNDDNLWHKIQNIHSIMTRAMGATDEFMSQLNYRSISRAKCLEQADKIAELAGKANDENFINDTADRLFKSKFDSEGKPTDVDAYNEARTILYQNNLDGKQFDNATGQDVQMREQTWTMGVAQNLQSNANKNNFIKFIFPFVKTGANILQMNLDHNGIYAALSTSQRKLLMSKTPEGALARSQVAFGTFSLAMGTMMAANDLITGSAPPDIKERKALFEAGWRPYSLKIGDKYVSYQGYEPLHTMLGFAADCFNLGQAITAPEDEDKWKKFSMQVSATLVNNFMDKAAFRTGLNQLSILTNPEKVYDWQKAMAQTASGFLPDVSMVKGLSSVGEREITQPQSAYERLFNNYFNKGLGDYRRDVFGDRQDIYGLLVTTAAVQGNEPEYQELSRLAEYGYSPSEIGTIVADTKVKFKDFKDPKTGKSAYDAMQEELSQTTLGGKTLKEAIRDLVTSQEYQMLPDGIDSQIKWSSKDDTKVNAINDIFRDYNDEAKENVINNNPQFVNKEGKNMQDVQELLETKKMDAILNSQLNGSADKIRSLF